MLRAGESQSAVIQLDWQLAIYNSQGRPKS